MKPTKRVSGRNECVKLESKVRGWQQFREGSQEGLSMEGHLSKGWNGEGSAIKAE